MTTTKRITDRWLMPIHFGSPFEKAGDAFEVSGSAFQETVTKETFTTETMTMAVSFATNREQLEAILPAGKGLELRGEPVVSVVTVYQGSLTWLAGRSYDLILISFPVTFNGRQRKVPGDFVPVVWENMTEPIIAGRELLGWSKIYSEISPASVLGNKMHCVASWHGFAFMDMTIEKVLSRGLCEITLDKIAQRGEIVAHFPHRVRPPVEFHLYADKGQQSITGVLPSHDFHWFGPSPEFLIQSLNDIGGTQGNPFFLGKVEEGQAAIQRVSQALHRGGDFLLPALGELGREFQSFLPAGSIEDRTDVVGHFLFQFPGDLRERSPAENVLGLCLTIEPLDGSADPFLLYHICHVLDRLGVVEKRIPLGTREDGGTKTLDIHDPVDCQLLNAQHLGMQLRDTVSHLQRTLLELVGREGTVRPAPKFRLLPAYPTAGLKGHFLRPLRANEPAPHR